VYGQSGLVEPCGDSISDVCLHRSYLPHSENLEDLVWVTKVIHHLCSCVVPIVPCECFKLQVSADILNHLVEVR